MSVRRLSSLSCAAWLGLVVLPGCAGQANSRLVAVRRTTVEARERGAYRCAPEELARAEAHAEFAKVELRAGELMRAESQLDLSEHAAARALAGAQACLTVAPLPPSAPLPDPAPEPKPLPPPPEPDSDGDGLFDKDDRCPQKAGPVAAQGCPDRDGDTVPDDDDQCPEVAGPVETHGCPPPKLIVVHDDKIELKQKIHFATGKANILPDSTPLLTEIVAALQQRPLVKVRIEGHTDARGSIAINTKLSRARADAVRAWLTNAGVAATRLTAVGYGPSQPIADNRTASGREENRRVEFFLLTE